MSFNWTLYNTFLAADVLLHESLHTPQSSPGIWGYRCLLLTTISAASGGEAEQPVAQTLPFLCHLRLQHTTHRTAYPRHSIIHITGKILMACNGILCIEAQCTFPDLVRGGDQSREDEVTDYVLPLLWSMGEIVDYIELINHDYTTHFHITVAPQRHNEHVTGDVSLL